MNSRIEKISQRSKGQILERLKKAHKMPDFEYKASVDPVVHIQRSGEKLEEMKRKMTDNKYIVEECDSGSLESKINEIVKSYGYQKMIYSESLGLDIDKIEATQKVCFNQEIENLRAEVFHSDFSVVRAKFGISSHGVALVHSSRAQPRMLSLAPTLCIMLLKKENVVGSLAEALNLVKAENEVLPSNILFIAGPSRTADIELITVFGVHGSQKVHLLLY